MLGNQDRNAISIEPLLFLGIERLLAEPTPFRETCFTFPGTCMPEALKRYTATVFIHFILNHVQNLRKHTESDSPEAAARASFLNIFSVLHLEAQWSAAIQYRKAVVSHGVDSGQPRQ